MDRLLKKIYNLERLDHSDIKAVKKHFAALNFILVEDDFRDIPRKILTSKGILELLGSFEEERDRCSELTENYSFGKTSMYNWSFYMNKHCYNIYKNSIITYLLSNKSVLIKFLNKKYDLNLTEKDILAKNILNNSIKLNRCKKINLKRNKKIEKQNVYLRTDYGTVLVTKCNKIFLLKRGKDERRINIKREYRRNSTLYKNERNFGNAYASQIF